MYQDKPLPNSTVLFMLQCFSFSIMLIHSASVKKQELVQTGCMNLKTSHGLINSLQTDQNQYFLKPKFWLCFSKLVLTLPLTSEHLPHGPVHHLSLFQNANVFTFKKRRAEYLLRQLLDVIFGAELIMNLTQRHREGK